MQKPAVGLCGCTTNPVTGKSGLLLGLVVYCGRRRVRLYRLNTVLARRGALVHFAAANHLSIAGFEGKVVFAIG
jgi:hypothetical protein